MVQPDCAGVIPSGPVSRYGVARPFADSGFAGTMMSQLTLAAAVVVPVPPSLAPPLGAGHGAPDAVPDAGLVGVGVAGAVAVAGTVAVAGAVAVAGTVAVTGAVAVAGTVAVTGAVAVAVAVPVLEAPVVGCV
jgi:hypothetical protein